MDSSTHAIVAMRKPARPAILAASTHMDFDTFYRSEFASMVALARTICGNHELAEDLAQEAMSRAHKHWHKVSTYERPGAWLRRVTINLAISRRRRLQRELQLLRRSAQEPRLDPGADPLPDHDVWEAVRRLPPRQRAVIALFYQEDQSTASIAEILECSVSTATSHLNQARNRLAEYLVDPSQAAQPAAAAPAAQSSEASER